MGDTHRVCSGYRARKPLYHFQVKTSFRKTCDTCRAKGSRKRTRANPENDSDTEAAFRRPSQETVQQKKSRRGEDAIRRAARYEHTSRQRSIAPQGTPPAQQPTDRTARRRQPRQPTERSAQPDPTDDAPPAISDTRELRQQLHEDAYILPTEFRQVGKEDLEHKQAMTDMDWQRVHNWQKDMDRKQMHYCQRCKRQGPKSEQSGRTASLLIVSLIWFLCF